MRDRVLSEMYRRIPDRNKPTTPLRGVSRRPVAPKRVTVTIGCGFCPNGHMADIYNGELRCMVCFFVGSPSNAIIRIPNGTIDTSNPKWLSHTLYAPNLSPKRVLDDSEARLVLSAQSSSLSAALYHDTREAISGVEEWGPF